MKHNDEYRTPPTVLRGMLVTDLRGHTVDITRFRDKHPRVAVVGVTATLAGYGIEVERYYSLNEAPRIGDGVDVEL